MGLAAAIVVIAGMKAAASIVGPAFLALILGIGIHPLQLWLRGRGWPSWACVITALVAIYGILIALVGGLVLSIARFATTLPTYQAKFDELIGQGQRILTEQGVGQDQVQKALNVDTNRVFSVASTLLGSTLSVMSALVFVVTLLLFVVIDAAGYERRHAALRALRPDIAQALEGFASGTKKFLVVSTIFGLIVAALDGVALWALGVPLPLLWALLAFITNYIPNLGFVIGLVPPAILALLEGGPGLMLIVIAVYSVLNFVVQSVIQPRFVGQTADLSVTWSMLSLFFWGWVLGPLGALLAIPLSLLAKALLVDIDSSNRWIDVLLKAEAPRDQRSGTPTR